MIRRFAVAVVAVATLAAAGCATNPVTGKQDVVMSSQAGEKEQSRRYYEQIIRAYGLYEDQAVQDYVNSVGQKVAKHSHLADWKFTFTVLDDGSINAFTTGGGYVYVHRGLLAYLNSEAELASVLGHEIGHVTARHPAKQQTRGVLASVATMAAAIATGGAIADLANIGAQAWMMGYGRENEMEADRLGLEYATKTGYRPEAMRNVFKVFQQQESFERDRAKAEGREPNLYHGVFSSHPAPDDRMMQAARGAAQVTDEPPGGWTDNRDAYLKAIDGLPYGSSRAQGIVRDNRFYHSQMGITMAFPRGWHVDNERDRLLAYTKSKDTIMQVTVDKQPEKQGPREFLMEKLRGGTFRYGESIDVNGMKGYAIVTTNGSPLDGGSGPVRWAVLYRDGSAFLFAGASRSANAGRPEADGLFMSSISTLRSLKPSEFPLAEPYRIKVIQADAATKLDDYAKSVPVEQFKKEELLLLNGLYPNKSPQPGDYVKVIE